MGLIKKAIAIGGIYYVAKKVHESHKDTQQCTNTNTQQQQQPSANTPYPQQRQHQPEPEQQQQQPLTTSRALSSNTAHQSYCNGQCGGQCSFNAAEQYGFGAVMKAPVYQEKALV